MHGRRRLHTVVLPQDFPVTLRMLRVKSDKSDQFSFQSIVFTQSYPKPECRWTGPEVAILGAVGTLSKVTKVYHNRNFVSE